MTRQARPIRLGPRSVIALALTSAVGAASLLWPFFAPPAAAVAGHSQDAPWLFAGLLVLLVAVVGAAIAESGLGAKAVAMLGVLAAAGAALRPIGAGTAGIEPMFFLMVLSGRVLGPGFGFALGSLSMFASALLTGGVGPWMPFQMLSMGWFTMGAGLLPGPHRLRGRGELALRRLRLPGRVRVRPGDERAGLALPPAGPREPDRHLEHCPGSHRGHRRELRPLPRLLPRHLPRLGPRPRPPTVVLTFTLGPAVLKALRRATRRAAFETGVTFEAPKGTPGSEAAHRAQITYDGK
ncbi:Integral membrane protein OS=Streptomyces glaucescens OX=1907 GN=SGLAU_10695 PE=4 SV=1 [Streptomyces glaucescens]